MCGLRRAVIAAFVFAASNTGAQIPDEFTNLDALPRDIGKGELISTMRGWTMGLGVRCNHCHVGPDNLVGMDFASDEKATKRAARQMFEMVRAINGQHLAGLPASAEGEQRGAVSCFTCHRGQAKPPRNLRELLGGTAAAEGVGQALAEYDTLREEHLGQGLYDFSAGTLAGLARQLAEAGRLEEAVRVAEKGVSEHPDDAMSWVGLAFLHFRAQNPDAAREAAKKALALDPELGAAKQILARLEDAG